MKKSILFLIVVVCISFLSQKVFAQSESSIVENQGIKLSGNWTYQIDYNTQTTHITGAKIDNNATEGKSGTIKISLYLTDTKYNGGSITGFAIANCSFEPLSAGYVYNDIDKTLNFDVYPPSKNYYITLLLLEYTDNGYVIKDYLNFDGTLAFNNRNTERVLGALSKGLNSLKNSLKNYNNLNTNNHYTNPNNGYTNKTNGHIQKVTCSYCKGTGISSGWSTVAAYGSTQEKWCPNCNKWVSASHGPHLNCIPCQGKGYTENMFLEFPLVLDCIAYLLNLKDKS